MDLIANIVGLNPLFRVVVNNRFVTLPISLKLELNFVVLPLLLI